MEDSNKEYIEIYLPAIKKNFDLKNPNDSFESIYDSTLDWCIANYRSSACLAVSIMYLN